MPPTRADSIAPMRIALVSPYSWSFPGGVTRHIEALSGELLAQGHEVRILTPVDGDGTGLPEQAIALGGTVALYDLGASGLSVTVVDTASRQICASERTSDISGEYLDSLIREQQIASGRIAHPADQSGLAALDELCRTAKEQLSSNSAVALPSTEGLVLLSQENFEALIMLAVESSARMTRDVILRSEQPPV